MSAWRRALARLLGVTTPTSQTITPRQEQTLGLLLAVGDHVIFATTPREAERALVLLMEGAPADLRRSCMEALGRVRGSVEDAAA